MSDPFSITPGAVNGEVGSPYSYQYGYEPGSYPPVSFSITSGSLPGGIGMDTSTALLAGTPSVSGTFDYTIQMADSNSRLVSTPDSITITGTTPPAPPTPCQELGRVTRAYVSGYNRNRVHNAQLMAQEVRCLTANFNGALCAGRTIASVVWSVSNPQFANLTQCEITGRETSCIVQAQWRGTSLVRCTATMDNNEVYTQYFALKISGYWFQGDTPAAQGPYQITAVAA